MTSIQIVKEFERVLINGNKCLRDRIAVVKNFNQITIRDTPESLHLKLSFKEGLTPSKNMETSYQHTEKVDVGTTRCLDQQALETEVTQLKDALTSLWIQNDGYKIENANVNRRYLELSTASTHSRTTLTGKMAILNDEFTN
ncbi:hypothetical protein Tco_0363402 [Tanacetum coccineum]